MRLGDILNGLDHTWVRGDDIDVTAIEIDSQQVRPGTVFWCLKGLSTNGHSYIPQAVAAGAAAVVLSEPTPVPPGPAVIQVPDTRYALAPAAENLYGHPATDLTLTGITGTKGKTTSTYMLASVLAHAGRSVGVIGTLGAKLNSRPLDIGYGHMTTPDPVELQRIFAALRDGHASDVAMEVSSHALALGKMEGLRFRVAVFTNLSQDHLDFHKTMAEYLHAKSLLFQQCDRGVVNADSDASSYICAHATAPVTTFGLDNEADVRGTDIAYRDDGTTFTLTTPTESIPLFIPVKGRFSVYNALGVATAALELGLDVGVIRDGLAAMPPVPGRLQDVPNDRGAHILVDYAHSPDSLLNVLTTARDFTRGRLIVVFGCGGDRDAGKRPIMGRIAGELADYTLLTSDNPRTEDPLAILAAIEAGIRDTTGPYETEPDRRAAITRAVALLEPGDTLVVAGKGHEDYQIIGETTLHFDDTEVIRDALG
ncbi:MAG: UDP-N-acetylmuramoyl-L-alanyl-D-glutamate--2,6-diaminopimelate ligase [Propionibacteriaceae bacterium]|jgi:UDP-N-acetylmuramoyl-L-alanyl-D-glutamate--2,6-diaminopimelate ligase|nr:UDP-N-acetylmuramoyl-L-alanyl-D-glutamate--2,6-diaminopimelate ligase [Propionibacteriaceae bacterium]